MREGLNYNHFLSIVILFSRQISQAARDILTRLLERKVADRLGSGPSDANELKETEFLNVLDFHRVVERGYTPEFIPPPPIEETDVRNFDAEFTEERVSLLCDCIFSLNLLGCGFSCHVTHVCNNGGKIELRRFYLPR